MKSILTIRTVSNGWIIERQPDNQSLHVISPNVDDTACVFQSVGRALAYLREEMENEQARSALVRTPREEIKNEHKN